MKPVFADTFYYLAIMNADDAAHERAVRVSATMESPVVTTAWVLTEVADAMSAPAQRAGFVKLLAALDDDPDCVIVPPTEGLFREGIALYEHRPDKNWSLSDCISFVVMQQKNMTDALTGDHHFEQAGFKVLL